MRVVRSGTIARLALLLPLVAAPARGATVIVQNLDLSGQGFNDPTPAAPVGGNPGTTIGAQRLNVINQVAATWGAALSSDVPIEVAARFLPLSCTTSSAVLATTGPTTASRDFAGAPRAATWYAIATANALAGEDLDPGAADMQSKFSSRLGQPGCRFAWYYGLDGAAPEGTIDLFTVALHELGHGLGYVALFDTESGQKLLGFDDAYLVNLLDDSTGQLLRTMTNGQRAAACVQPEELHWVGAEATAAAVGLTGGVGPQGRVHMYSPATLSLGSSVSHVSTSVAPNDLMEPFFTMPTRDLDLTLGFLADVGWQDQVQPGSCVPSSSALCVQGDRFEVRGTWRDFADNGGAMQVVGQQTSDSGLLYFYGPNNWEILGKVLDACGSGGGRNDHFWFFAAAATTLEYTLTVTDTLTGAVRTYFNPLGVASPAITDTLAFDCP